MKYTRLFGLNFVNTTFDQFVNKLVEEHINKQVKATIVTANPEIVVHSFENQKYREYLMMADYVTPDGVGIVKSSKILKTVGLERITGIDLVVKLLEVSDKRKLKIYLLGARNDVLKKAISNIKARYKNLNICGYHNGYFNNEECIIITNEIREKKPDIVFVALGAPKQEEWIMKNTDKINKGLFLGVGGSFDVLSGYAKRAPRFLIQHNLEWLYRIFTRPNKLKKISYITKFCFIVSFYYLKRLKGNKRDIITGEKG